MKKLVYNKINIYVTSSSAVTIGFVLRTLLKKFNDKASKYLYWTIFCICSSCMVVAGVISTIKLISKPIGSEINFEPFDDDVHKATLSVCKICESLYQYTDTIPALKSVSYQENSNDEWIGEDDTGEASPLYFWVNEQSFLCKSFPLKGNEVKILHTAYGTNDKNMHIYLHKTGDLGSGLEVKINKDLFKNDNIFLLQIEVLHLISDDGKCSDDGHYQNCREEYISVAVNNYAGCVLKFMRYKSLFSSFLHFLVSTLENISIN